MKFFLYPLCCLLAIQLHGQATRGVTPLAGTSGNASIGTTWAMVVGISDYQAPGIPDLRFADKDAAAFAAYLRSPAGGAVDDDHLSLFLNEQATGANVAMALSALMEEAQEGDRVIIYFSGHGDVETKRMSQAGYLLCWDSNPKVYFAGGTLKVNDLQDIVATLAAQNKARVVLITDACHSGTLAGSDIKGSQVTAKNMSTQFANEIKILSCQPNEFSIEGEQWGGGRGAFSFNLVDALYGLADENNDLFVTLKEVGRYLEDHVTEEVAPATQVPMVVGNRLEQLVSVDSRLVEALRSGKSSQQQILSPVDIKGLEDDVLAAATPEIREQYLAFKTALANGALMSPAGASANDLYIPLSKEASLAPLYGLMRRNLAAALLNESQQVINNVLQNDPVELAKIFGRGLYQHVPGYMERAAELLGSNHFMYKRVKGLQYLFEAYNLVTNSPYPELVVLQKKEAIPLAEKALELAGAGAFIYDFLGDLYAPVNTKSAVAYFEKSTELSPTYASPYNNMGMLYSQVKNPFLKKRYYKKAIKTDPRYFPAYDNIGSIYRQKGKYNKAEKWYQKSVEVFPNALAYSNLGLTYYKQKRYAAAEAMCLKGIETQATYFRSYLVLADVYKASQQDARLKTLLDTMERQAEARHGDYSEVALGYLYLKDDSRFRSNYYKANARSEPLEPAFFYKVCRNYALQDNKEAALIWLELALSRGFNDRKKLRKDDALKSIRKDARFRNLKRKYRKDFKLTCKDCLWSEFKKEEM